MGPLHGIKILEVGGIGPNPFAGMLLADMGADVIRLDRTAGGPIGGGTGISDPTLRGRQVIPVNLKDERELVLDLAEKADALIEGFRPGVMERLGLGPDDVWARNQKLVYGRMTGFGQDGPLSQVAGHDINYISLTGALGASKRVGERPMFAMNLVGDFGGGAMFLVFGVVCALLEARTSGRGQVVDAAMVDGATVLTTLIHGLVAGGAWDVDQPGTNLLDTGPHFYEVYETSDGGFMAVGAIEPQFYARMLELLEIPADEMPQWDKSRWEEFKERLVALFATRTAAEWGALLEGEETCVTVIRGLGDASEHPHMQAREAFVTIDGVKQPNAAPRFSRTPSEAKAAQQDVDGALSRWGVSRSR